MPTDWPSPPFFEHHLLESPWAAAALLAAAGVMLFLAGGRIGRRRVQIAAVVPVLLAGLVVGLAYGVTTDRERMMEATDSLVRAAVSPFNVEAVEAMTDDAFVMTVTDGTRIVEGKAALLDAIRRAERVMTISSATVSNRIATLDEPGEGRVYIALFNEMGGTQGGGLAKTRWVFHWRRAADGGAFELVKAEWLSANDLPVPTTLLPR